MTADAGRMPPAPGPVRWAVRAYAPLLVLSIALAMVVVPWVLRAQSQSVYESQALVVARQFTLPLAALPRYGEAVFDNGAVAADVGRRYGLSTAGDSLIPNKLSVVTGQDSVVMTVTARDEDRQLAADIANTAAEAYLDELNRPGPGLAVFVLQSAATPSAEPASGAPGTPVQLAVGAVAGGLLGLGLIGLLYVLRRPVVDPHDIQTLVGAPVLGVVRFPGRTVHDPSAVPGLAPVARALARSAAHDVYVVSPPDRRAQRAAVARMLVVALARWRPAALQTYDAARGGWVRPDDRDLGYAPSLVITDVARPLDAGPEAVDSDTLLVVREGTPERRLWHMLADHADSSYLGVVVVRRASWLPVRLRTWAGQPSPRRDDPSPPLRHARAATRRDDDGPRAAIASSGPAEDPHPAVPPVGNPSSDPVTSAAPVEQGLREDSPADQPVRPSAAADPPAAPHEQAAPAVGASAVEPAAPPPGQPDAPVEERADGSPAERDQPRVHVRTTPVATDRPAALPWQDAALLLGLGTERSSADADADADRQTSDRRTQDSPQSGWPHAGPDGTPRPGAATGWPGAS